ncbi:restriction endonuclease subunit S [Treponema phagedenis]|nr:restriction endonuclease subunit S [Treponema phagedenis]NVP23481.1 restriction endonuclease subunit S [Treponema phagedenis]QLC58322.1 restriction endonuclease subunit S [Treponema phagedenis]
MSKRLSLEDVEWREFRIKDIFETFHGSNGLQTPTGSYIPKNELYISSIPRITVRDTNNGIDSYCSSNNKNYRCFENFISVSFMGSAFYHPYKASLDMKVHALIPKNFHLTKNISLFLIRSLKNNTKFYSYGNQLSSTDLPRQKMLLPVDNKNEPNWQFMEDYIKQEQKIIAHKVIDYYEQKMLETAFDLVGLEDVEWKNFKLGSLFTFERKPSKGLNHLDTDKNRGISYLGATNKNNGVLEFVDPISNLVYRGNCIAFIRNGEGSMGYSVYKKENFMATQDISVGYNENLNQYNGMFITTVADRVRGKYNFGYKRNQSRLENEILTLPADKNGNPHWEYMSKFMQKLEVEKISNFLPYIYIYIYI